MRIGINAIFLVAGKGGGIERYLRNLIKALQKIDHENEYVVFTNRDNTGTFDLQDNFKEYYSPISACFRPIKIVWEQFVLPFQLKRAGIDVLFSAGNISPLFPFCLSIVVIHDLVPFVWPINFNKVELCFLRALFFLSAKRATKIVTVSKSSQMEIIDRLNIPSDKISVVYEGCDENFLSFRISKEDKKKVKERFGIKGEFILCTASTRLYKNIDRLLLAFNLLRKQYKNRQFLVITGRSGRHHKSLLEMVQDLGLENDVVFTGYVSDNDLRALYSEASVFVYPSLYEGFGLPVLEAMACGTAVVASNAASLPEVVGDAGLLFDPHDIQDMANALYRMVTEESLRKKCILKGHERVRLFSWQKAATELLSIFTLANRSSA